MWGVSELFTSRDSQPPTVDLAPRDHPYRHRDSETYVIEESPPNTTRSGEIKTLSRGVDFIWK